jgi:hypothetical protein
MTSHILEPVTEHIADWRGDDLHVDFAQRLVTHVILSGDVSRNGHRYAPDVLRTAAPLYDRKPVFLDHAPHPGRPYERSTRDLVGAILNPRYEDERLRGDIQVLDTEAGRTFLALLAANHPAVGMSHVVLVERGGDPRVIERIHDVVSVDAVLFPATTQGLRESVPDTPEAWEALAEQFDPALAAHLRQLRADLHSARETRDQLQRQLADHEREAAQRLRRARIARELQAAGLPDFADTPAFREQLEQLDDEAARHRLIAERTALARRCRPQTPASESRQGRSAEGDAAFVHAIRRGRPPAVCGW